MVRTRVGKSQEAKGDQRSFLTQLGGQSVKDDFLEKGMTNWHYIGGFGTRQGRGRRKWAPG